MFEKKKVGNIFLGKKNGFQTLKDLVKNKLNLTNDIKNLYLMSSFFRGKKKKTKESLNFEHNYKQIFNFLKLPY